MKTKTSVLVEALYDIADNIESDDAVAESYIMEAAERITILAGANKAMAEMSASLMGDVDDLWAIADKLFKSLASKSGITDEDLCGLASYQIWRKEKDIRKANATSCVESLFPVDHATIDK
jgi:hypothetical protein